MDKKLKETIELIIQLDEIDLAEIRGTIKIMLKKILIKKERGKYLAIK